MWISVPKGVEPFGFKEREIYLPLKKKGKLCKTTWFLSNKNLTGAKRSINLVWIRDERRRKEKLRENFLLNVVEVFN